MIYLTKGLSHSARLVLVWNGNERHFDRQAPFRKAFEWAYSRDNKLLRAFVVPRLESALEDALEDVITMTGIEACRDEVSIVDDALHSYPLVLVRDGDIYRGFSFDEHGTQSGLQPATVALEWEKFAPPYWKKK